MARIFQFGENKIKQNFPISKHPVAVVVAEKKKIQTAISKLSYNGKGAGLN